MVAQRKFGGAGSRRRAGPRLTSEIVYNRLCQRFGDPTKNAMTQPPWVVRGRGAAIGGQSLDDATGRDLDRECGYEPAPQYQHYRALYDRVGPAHRAVNIWPDESWAAYPLMYETNRKIKTPFEKSWADLTERVPVWGYCHRVNRLSRICHFGSLMLGLDDGMDPSTPALSYNLAGTLRKNTRQHKLLYMRAFDERQAAPIKFEDNVNNIRYGQPTLYEIQAGDTQPQMSGSVDYYVPGPSKSIRVHWTRMLHVADNREASEVHGVPTLRPVMNILYDIRKVAGSAAEMFWKGGFPGYAFSTFPDLTGEAVIDPEELRTEVAAYVGGLQRYLSAVGGEWKSLAPQVADPGPHLEKLFQLLCSTLGIPMRIFFGTESGQLSSTQDAGTWKERLTGYQQNYLEPFLVRPLVNRLLDLGCLARPEKYIIEWRDLRTLGETDRADVFLKQMQALNMYSTGNVSTFMPWRFALTVMAGLSDEMADAIIAVTGEKPVVPPDPIAMAAARAKSAPARAKPQGGARRGASAGARPARKAAA